MAGPVFRGGLSWKIVEGILKRDKSLNSAEWLERRLKDPYVEKAKIENYRCRSAFKLIEIDDKFKIIKPGQCVIDIGAAPGSWTQVLVKRTNAKGQDEKKPKGTVISVDRSPISGLDGAIILSGMDFTRVETQNKITEVLNGRKLDFVLSDMAPNASGVRALDAENILNLVASVLTFAVHNLRENGGCLVKMWDGRQDEIANVMKRFFGKFNYVKPNSTQKESTETYLLGRNFKGALRSAFILCEGNPNKTPETVCHAYGPYKGQEIKAESAWRKAVKLSGSFQGKAVPRVDPTV